ncbi:MAG: EamA family transporter [Noviherbaspirillum sp.]
MRETHLSGRDLLAAGCIVLIWGTNFVAMKIGLRSFTPFQLGAARYLFAMLPLILLVRAPRLHWKWLLLYGLCQGVGQFGLLFVSLQIGMTAALASVLLQTQLFFTALLSFFVLAEKPGKPLLAGMGLAALGLCCFAMNYLLPAAGAAATTALGFAMCLAAASMWAASNIVVRLVQRAAPDFEPLSFLVWCSAVPVLPFAAMALLFDDPASRWQWTAAPWQGWMAVAYLGWVATIFGYTMWTRLIKRHGANRIAPFSLGVPVVGLSSGMLFLGETITGWQWAGIVLIVAALVCVLFGGRLARLR